jgi:hypothetical protein
MNWTSFSSGNRAQIYRNRPINSAEYRLVGRERVSSDHGRSGGAKLHANELIE